MINGMPPVDEHYNEETLSEGDDTDSSESDLVELNDDEFPSFFNERNGTLFHTSPNSPYPLPVDANELARFNLIHQTLHRLLGAHCLGPVDEVLAPTPHRTRKVLDICTGNGKWVMDMAEAFPQVRFRGVDIVPISTRYPLPNVRFEMHDVVGDRFRWRDGDFDLIHARDISMAICNWPNLINECARLLRPGGLFVSCEWIHFPVADPSSTGLDVNTYAPASVRFFETIRRILEGKGIQLESLDICLSIAQSRRFTDINTERQFAPIGQWPEDETQKSIGSDQKIIFRQFTASVMPMLIDAGMTEQEAEQLTVDYLGEVDNRDGLACEYVITYARRI